jgi:DNA-binding GntR family transcriptional regulator
MILAGTLKPGDLLQEGKLGDELAMSRTPVREAIKRIEAEGLAVQEGRFLKVRTLTVAEVEEIFYLRRVLERQCARNAVTINPDILDSLETRVLHLQREGPGEEEEQRQVDDDFHYALARAAGNQMMIRTISDLRRRTCMFDHSQVPERFGVSCQEHLDIIHALRTRDGERAAMLMDEHIAHARDAIVGRLSLSNQRTQR